MSSSHLFLGLPIALLVLYFELSSGFQLGSEILNLKKVRGSKVRPLEKRMWSSRLKATKRDNQPRPEMRGP